KETPAESAAEYRARIHLQQMLCEDLWRASKPVVAAINGYALGGGLEMALHCDFRIAGRSAKLGTPAVRIGAVSTGGLHGQLAHAVGTAWSAWILLLGDSIDAETALRIGLVTTVCDDKQLLPEAERLAARLASYPRASMTAAKRAFERSSTGTLGEQLLMEE